MSPGVLARETSESSNEVAPEPVPRLGLRGSLAIVLLAAAVRVAATAWVGFSTLGFGDARAYVSAAKTLAETGRYPPSTDVTFFRAPGYPVLLVAATFGDLRRIPMAKLANIALGSLSALLLAALSGRLFRHRGLAIATGIAAALNPSFILVSTDVQSEPLFLFLFLCSGLFLLSAADRPSSTHALVAGVFLALAALTRPSALMLVPLLLAPLLDRRHPLRARGHIAASALLGFTLALSPWTLRNALVFGELIPVNDAAGTAFYQGNSDWHVRFHELTSRAEYDRWLAGLDRDMREQWRNLDGAVRNSPSARSRHFVRKALAERSDEPGSFARLLFQKAWDWLRPYPSPWFWPPGIVIATGCYYTLLLGFSAAGLLLAPRRGVALFCLALLAITMTAHVVVIVVWRYKVPYWDPILLLYGVFAAGITLGRLWKPRISSAGR